MSAYKVDSPEGDFYVFLETIGELVWRRFQQRRPGVMVGRDVIRTKDHTSWPPFAAFRLEPEDTLVMEKLRKTVADYDGRVKWRLSGRKREYLPGTNYLIEPERRAELREQAESAGLGVDEYLMAADPNFGAVANADFLDLIRHLEKAFGVL